jgi:hypothetical protein
MHLQYGDHVPKLAIEPTKKCKNHGLLPMGSPNSPMEVAIDSRWRQQSVTERAPCRKLWNSASRRSARDSCCLRNSFSRKSHADREEG